MSLSTKTTKFLVSTVVALGLAGAASATDRTFNKTDSNWNEPTNWTPNGLPVNGDTVTIPSGKICTVDITTARADAFVVESGGLLIIDTGKLLEIDSNSSVAQVQGVRLVGSNSELKISGTLTISGAGSVQGLNEAAKINVTSGVELRNTSTIEGKLVITGEGTFVNGDDSGDGTGDGGIVKANSDGKLEVNTDFLGVDESASQWRVSDDEDAVLKLSVGTTGMYGSFYLDDADVEMWFAAELETAGGVVQLDGLLHIDQNLAVGTYTFDGGTGNIASEKEFRYTNYVSNPPISNPNTGTDNGDYIIYYDLTPSDYTWPV